MRSFLALLVIATFACGGHSSSTSDGGGGDGNGPPGGDGPAGIDAPSGGPTNVTLTLTNHPTDAGRFSFLVAYQDGSGPWQLAPAPTGDTYTLPINSAAYGVAWTCVPPTTGTSRVELGYFAVAEKTSLTETVPPGCTDRLATPVALTGTVTNVSSGAGAYVAWFGGRQALVNVMGTTGTFRIMTPPGTHDLVIAHGGTAGGVNANLAVDDIAVVRAVAVNGPTTAGPVDFSTATIQTVGVTVNTTMTARTTVATYFYSAGGTTAQLVRETTSPFDSRALDNSAAATGDVYDQDIRVVDNGSTARVESWSSTITAQTYSAPTALGGALASVAATTPYPEIATQWNAYSGAVGYAWTATQGGTLVAPALEWAAAIGPGYVGASPQFQMPDLTGLTGWNSALALQTGIQVNGAVAAVTSTAGEADFPPATPASDGTARTIVSSLWTATP